MSDAINKDVAIALSKVNLILKGPVIFSEISIGLCLLYTDYNITFYNYIEFSNIKTNSLICGSAYFNLNIMNNAYIKIKNNKISAYIFSIESDNQNFYKFCYFQFYKISDENYNFTRTKKPIIEIASENAGHAFDENTENINCKWHSDSLYYGFNPLQVYVLHFKLINSSNHFDTGLLCKFEEAHKSCHTNVLEPIYPGQNLKLQINLNSKITDEERVPITVRVYDNDSPHTICKVSSLLEAEQVVHQNCTEVTYNILSDNTELCKLILYNTNYNYPTVYFIKLLKCPAGFSFNALEKKCACDNNLHSELILIKECDINDQTLLHPPNGWISATTQY